MEILRRFFGKTAKESSTSADAKQAILGLPDQRVKRGSESLLDEVAYESEMVDMAKLRDELDPATLILRSEKDSQKYRSLQRRYEVLVPLTSSFLESKSGNDSETYREVYVRSAFYAGAVSLLFEVLGQQFDIASKSGYSEKFKPYFELQKFIQCGVYSVRIGQVSIRSIYEPNLGSRTPLSEFLRFFMEAHLSRRRVKDRHFFEPDSGELSKRFPEFTKLYIQEASLIMAALTSLGNASFRDLQEQEGGYREAYYELSNVTNRANRLSERVFQLRQRIFHTLLKPSDPNFMELKGLAEMYLKAGRIEKTVFLFMVGLRELDQVNEMYRKSREFAEKGIESDFYELLADSIFEYVTEEFPSGANIYTAEDVPIFLETEKEENPNPPPSFEELGQMALVIHKNTKVREFSLDPRSIELGDFVKPKSVSFKFDNGKPRQFSITLLSTSPSGDHFQPSFEYDAKNKSFDWNIIDSPSSASEDLQRTRREAMRLAKLVLSHIESTIEGEKTVERVVSEITVPEVPKPKIKREQTVVPVSQKTSRMPKQPDVLTPIKRALAEPFVPFEEERVRNQIIVPDKRTLQKLLRRLSFVDRQTVEARIAEYNENQLGRFQQLEETGEPMFSFRVNCSARGGVRVLMREVQGRDKVRLFEIFDIDYRKNLLRKI